MAVEASIKTCASALIDDLVESGSFLRSQISACDYGVLGSATCSIVVQPLTSTTSWATWNTLDFIWGLRLECYIRDTNNPIEVLTMVWDMHDAILGAIMAGSNLNTLHRKARPVSFERPPDTFAEYGGHDFVPVYITVAVEEEG